MCVCFSGEWERPLFIVCVYVSVGSGSNRCSLCICKFQWGVGATCSLCVYISVGSGSEVFLVCVCFSGEWG